MYRLTVSGSPAVTWRTTHPSAPTAWMRVYRWENKWGSLMKQGRWEDVWNTEIRTPLAYDVTAMQLFESLESIQSTAPPPDIDDMWEEEIAIDKNITCNALLSIKGTLFEIQSTAHDLGITLAPTISGMISKIDQRNQIQGLLQPAQPPLQRVQPLVQPQQPHLQIQATTQGSQLRRIHPIQHHQPPRTFRESQPESVREPRQHQFQSRNDAQGQAQRSRPSHASSQRMQQDSSQNRQYEERSSTDPQKMHQTNRTQFHQSRPKYPQQLAQPAQERRQEQRQEQRQEKRQGLLPTPPLEQQLC